MSEITKGKASHVSIKMSRVSTLDGLDLIFDGRNEGRSVDLRIIGRAHLMIHDDLYIVKWAVWFMVQFTIATLLITG